MEEEKREVPLQPKSEGASPSREPEFAAECPFDRRAADVASGAVSRYLAVAAGLAAFLAGAAVSLLFGFMDDDVLFGGICLALSAVLGAAIGILVPILNRRSARGNALPDTRIGLRVEGGRICMYMTRSGEQLFAVWREVSSLYGLERRRGYIVIFLARMQANIVAEDAFSVGDAQRFCAYCAARGVRVK